METNNTATASELEQLRSRSQHGRPESYWAERNALVDAVLAAQPRVDVIAYYSVPPEQRVPVPADVQERYDSAVAALAAFDAAHGGAPVL